MYKQTRRSRWMAWIAILVALAATLAGCFDLSGQQAETTSLVSPLPTDTADPNVIIIEPGEDYIAPTWTPLPTYPPPPTPTRRPGPTATPLPLLQPAKDAAGTILYVVRAADKVKATVYGLPVDAAGNPIGPPADLTSSTPIRWGSAYPAPDGRRLAIVNEWGGRVIFYTDSGKIRPLFGENLDPRGLTFGWHPDSRQVLIRADDNYLEMGLWLVDADTGERTVLAMTVLGSIQGGAVSPDGQKAVYVYEAGITTELWVVNTDGSDPQLLYSEGALAPAWSPDGSKIAFAGGDGVMVIDADSSNPRAVGHNFAVGYCFQLAWSPDSRTLAVVGVNGPNPLYEKNPANEKRQKDWFADAFLGHTIYLLDVATGEERPLLADDSSGNIDPAWSPDGTQLTFASTRDGTSQIWVVDADGTNLRQLTQGSQLVRFPYWRRP